MQLPDVMHHELILVAILCTMRRSTEPPSGPMYTATALTLYSTIVIVKGDGSETDTIVINRNKEKSNTCFFSVHDTL